MRSRAQAPALALAAMTVLLAGCSGAEPEPLAPIVDGTMPVTGNTAVRWDPTTLDVVTVDGSLQVILTCDGAVPHDLIIEGVGTADEPLVSCDGNDEATGSVAIEPGVYTFYCNVTGHRASGMEGVVVVS